MAEMIEKGTGGENHVRVKCTKMNITFPSRIMPQTGSNERVYDANDPGRDMMIQMTLSKTKEYVNKLSKPQNEADYVELSDTTPHPWFERARVKNETILTRDELIDFLQLGRRTYLGIESHNQVYFVRLSLPKVQTD
ncbi:hypothetical protein [Candidatus Nitrososphaera sp. FF02]|uniref:hypothetical protein n=1 Tax=Candidatus Nitrososphaera sp. FF02 TaxID=3398226 RepID=UPI0039EB6007